jgi:hypothetical protein
VTEGHTYKRFQRVLEWRNLLLAETVAREMPQLSLDDALRLVHVYGECESPKFERAAIKWLQRYLAEGSPELRDVAMVVTGLVERREGPYRSQ